MRSRNFTVSRCMGNDSVSRIFFSGSGRGTRDEGRYAVSGLGSLTLTSFACGFAKNSGPNLDPADKIKKAAHKERPF